MSEFTEFRQPSALKWTPEVSGTWLAYESQDTQRAKAPAVGKPAQPEKDSVVAVPANRLGETLNFGKDAKGYYYFKGSGEDHYKMHYLQPGQKWARLESVDNNGKRVTTAEYDLDVQRKNVDQWWAQQKPAEQTPMQNKTTHLEVPPVFKNTEQQTLAGKPLLPDQYHHWASLVDSMNVGTDGNQLGVLRMIAGTADKAGSLIDDQIGAMHDYIEGNRNPDPKLRVQQAVMMLASASRYLIAKDANGDLVFSVKDNSPAGAYLNAAIEQLDKAVQSSDSFKTYADYGRTNNQARNLKSAIVFTKISLETGALKMLNGRPLPQLLPPGN